jgi:hypothetical protein
MKTCTKESQKVVFREIVRGTKQVLNSLCETGDFQNSKSIKAFLIPTYNAEDLL